MIGYLAVTAIKIGLSAMRQQQSADSAREQEENDAALAQLAASRRAEAARELAEERAKSCCASCGTEVTLGVVFCHSCGGSSMTDRGAFIDLETDKKVQLQKAEAARRAVEQAEEIARLGREKREKEQRQAEKERHQAAIRRCRELLAWRYCEPCHVTFESTHRFCSGCGKPTQNLPRSFGFEYAQQEYPDLIISQANFDCLT